MYRYIVFISLLWNNQFLLAGSYTVAPVIINISSDNNPTSVDLTNNDNIETNIHLQIVQWKQENSIDIYQETEDLLVVPAVVTLSPKQTQTIRIAFKGQLQELDELSYRLLIKEIPNLSSKKKGGLSILMNMSLPIFILPKNETKVDFNWKIENTSNNQVKVLLINTGKNHILIKDIVLLKSDGKKIEDKTHPFKYALPNSSFYLDTSLKKSEQLKNLKIKANINNVEYIENLN